MNASLLSMSGIQQSLSPIYCLIENSLTLHIEKKYLLKSLLQGCTFSSISLVQFECIYKKQIEIVKHSMCMSSQKYSDTTITLSCIEYA